MDRTYIARIADAARHSEDRVALIVIADFLYHSALNHSPTLYRNNRCESEFYSTNYFRNGCRSKNSQISLLASISILVSPNPYCFRVEAAGEPGQVCPPPLIRYNTTSASISQLRYDIWVTDVDTSNSSGALSQPLLFAQLDAAYATPAFHVGGENS